jgi:hypothetical protein
MVLPMLEKIHERVPALFLFDPFTKRKYPARLLWRGRVYPIKKLGLHYILRAGRTLIHIFTVSTDTLDFKLRFDTEELTCVVEKVTEGLAS